MGFFDIFRIDSFKAQIKQLQEEKDLLESRFKEIGGYENIDLKKENDELRSRISQQQNALNSIKVETDNYTDANSKLEKQIATNTKKLRREKELYKAMEYSLERFSNDAPVKRLDGIELNEAEEYAPSVMLHLHCMDIKSLRTAYRENDKQIDKLLMSYSSRYTTKANQAIYKLMVIALRAELQNALVSLKYEKLDDAISHIKDITSKYLKIAGEGNQNIVNTLEKFIGEVEYLFINAVKVEYNYYVKNEQKKQEQALIREQMRQEAKEKKALEEEKNKIEAEQKKYNDEIERLRERMTEAHEEELQALKDRINQLQGQVAEMAVKKEKIIELANGKAGCVYIISNIGSFGENVFKIGMTRRQEPQDRVNELGDASVPFKFDVHSFIFSNDAVKLETELHRRLNDRRVNKVNLRREFFNISLDELEALIQEIEPTAPFTRLIPASEYRQSISSDENYTSDYIEDIEEEDEE